MANKKTLIVIIGRLVVLALLIGLGPIIVASIMKKISRRQALFTSPQNEPSKPEELSKTEKPKAMLMVTGEVGVEKDDDSSWIILTTGSGKKYILIGPKAEELRNVSGRKVTVIGIPSKPIPAEIKGKPIRMTIEVKSAEIK